LQTWLKKDIAIWRASGFNELFEAALKKECERRAVEPEPGSGLGDEEGTKWKQPERFGPEVGELKDWMKKVVMGAEHNTAQKWTWGCGFD